ncbi:MAG: ATP-binding protein [Lewinellaceae bacterium]|nr:ATP-binding protein [Phaeodactylibacter sp.]MCB9265771.1 ATP-binding protein [Lewinellaceae bacterium]MCB9352586.1 ATP-binding protein [Lewinellaceae bacterium]
MTTDTVKYASIRYALQYLEQVIALRLKAYFSKKNIGENLIPPLDFSPNGQRDPMVAFMIEERLTLAEAILLFTALAPHVQPDFFDSAIQQNLPREGDFPKIGGLRGKQFRGFLPTGETILFLLAGDNLEQRFELQDLFSEDHLFARRRILWLEDPPEGEPRMSGKVVLSQEYLELFTRGKVSRPRFSLRFPAQLIETEREWEDLVLNEDTMMQIRELESYLKHGKTLMEEWGMSRKLKPGYRVLFHGPPGTGKTLTASLLGKYTGRETYKIDLSMVVSKYIGETEKNLANLFAKAENKEWILFFDEADALFGKRTNVKDAHDKYANQEVSYLLQRVENYSGLVILASNLKSNIDDAFIRRFQSVIHFPFPKASERHQIWQRAFPDIVELASDVNLAQLAQKYELSGAEIMNIVQFCCLHALDRDSELIEMADIAKGIRKEYLKEGKISH